MDSMQSLDWQKHGNGVWPDPPVARRTFLCADVDSFSQLTETLGDRRTFALIRRIEELVRVCCDEPRGETVEVRGDGFLLAFASTRAAASCALAIAGRVEWEMAATEGRTLSVRMALHGGEVLKDGERYFGRALIAAFRLLERAESREILFSAETATELLGVRSRLDWEHFEPKGLCGEMRFMRVGRGA